MMWLLTGATAVVFVEVVLALPILPRVAALAAIARQVQRVVVSPRISDHWKQKTLVIYSRRLLQGTLSVAALLLLATGLLAAWSLALAQSLDDGFVAFSLSPTGLACATAFALAYVCVRSRLVARRS